MPQKTIPILISLIFLIVSFILSSFLIQENAVYKKAKEQLAAELSYKNRFFNPEEWEPLEEHNADGFNYKDGQIDVNLYFGSSNKQKEKHNELTTTIQTAERAIQWRVFGLLISLLIYSFIMSAIYIYKKPPMVVLITLLSLSIICLYTGLFTPMLEIGAIERDLDLGTIPIQKNVLGFTIDLTVQKKFEGDIYFYYQSKSIAQLIQLLFNQNNFLVGFSILLFSVIFPLLKTCLMVYFVFRPQIEAKKWFKNIVLNLSKWSMADVFVVAIFLGFLAFGNLQAGVGTYSNISIGLYFFFAYCMLSIISSMLVKMPTEETF